MKTSMLKGVVRALFATMLLVLMTSHLFAAATLFVSVDGAGTADGSDWDNAFSAAQLQTAIDAALAADSVIYLQEGTYELSAQLDISSAAGLTLSGGWVGNDNGGLPGDPAAERSVLMRDSAAGNMRILEA